MKLRKLLKILLMMKIFRGGVTEKWKLYKTLNISEDIAMITEELAEPVTDILVIFRDVLVTKSSNALGIRLRNRQGKKELFSAVYSFGAFFQIENYPSSGFFEIRKIQTGYKIFMAGHNNVNNASNPQQTPNVRYCENDGEICRIDIAAPNYATVNIKNGIFDIYFLDKGE